MNLPPSEMYSFLKERHSVAKRAVAHRHHLLVCVLSAIEPRVRSKHLGVLIEWIAGCLQVNVIL